MGRDVLEGLSLGEQLPEAMNEVLAELGLG
jgi:hypothetical protein